MRILADVEEANLSVSSSHSAPQGTIRVACSLLFGHVYMTKVAADFMRVYPGVDVEIVATNRRVDVIEEGFDLAVVFMDPSEDSGLIARKLHSTELRCCASPAYFAARGVPLEPKSVTSHNCIVYGESRLTTWRFERSGKVQSVPIRGHLSVNSLVMAQVAAKSDVGIAALPSFLCDEDVREGRLVYVLEDWNIARTEVRVVYPSNRYLAPRVRLFVEALVAGYNNAFENRTVAEK